MQCTGAGVVNRDRVGARERRGRCGATGAPLGRRGAPGGAGGAPEARGGMGAASRYVKQNGTGTQARPKQTGEGDGYNLSPLQKRRRASAIVDFRQIRLRFACNYY